MEDFGKLVTLVNVMDGNLAMLNQWENHPDNPEILKKEIRSALTSKKFYNPYDVFNHEPEFYESDDDKYLYKIHIVKWNTKSTRMTVLYVRWNDKKQSWIFSRKKGLKRTPHNEKMR